MESLENLTAKQQKSLLNKAYHKDGLSWETIAKKYGKSRTSIQTLARKLGIQSRTRSESQKIVLKKGHPLKGKTHSESSKLKISESIGKLWDEMSDEEKEHRSQITKEQWKERSAEERERIQQAGSSAIRATSIAGSKFERFVLIELKKKGYVVEFHKTHYLKNEEMHIDLFLTKLAVAIEIDGPSHFEPVWGQEQLERIRRADAQKTGLILGEGLCLVRIKQKKKPSQRFKRQKFQELLTILESIEEEFPAKDNRYYEI